MNTRRIAARRVGDEIANVGDTPQGNRIPPQVQGVANDQAPVNPLVMKDGEERESLLQMSQAITTQESHYDTS